MRLESAWACLTEPGGPERRLELPLSPEQELSALFIDHPQKRSYGRGFWANLWATHPPIEERIAALQNAQG